MNKLHHKNNSAIENLKKAFSSFMAEKFEEAADLATKSSWGGSGYSVELFEDGHYRILWDNQIGNLYNSTGLILSVPSLADEEWDDDPAIRFYDNAEELMREKFTEAIKEIEDYDE